MYFEVANVFMECLSSMITLQVKNNENSKICYNNVNNKIEFNRKGLLVMLESPQGQTPVDYELGVLPLDWVEPKPLPKI